MPALAKTEAIIVWDIENTRVPLQLIPRCFEIVQWLLQDIQEQSPNSTVLRVYVAGTFEKYPTQLKNALCTHPRVQLLYSVGKVAKGGEADDALKRVMLDFHTTQLVAQKQALIVLLSGDADYNDVVDASRIAGHKVHLYHSHAVAQTLKGNVDHHEAWQDFLARKSGQKVQELQDTGYMARGGSPTSTSSGTPIVHRRVPHSHPGVKPVTIRASPNTPRHTTPVHHKSMRHAQAASDADSAMQASSTQGRTVALTRFRSKQPPAAHSSSNTAGQADLMEQPSQAPQDSTDSEPTQPIRRRHRGSAKQLCMSSLGNPAAALHSGAAGQDQCEAIGRSPSTCTTNMSHQAPPGFASPASDGRTVVVTGFNKGLAGPEARQRAVDLCSQHGETTACWLRKGKSSCWFIIVQYTETAAAQTAVDQHSSKGSQSGVLSVRWYMAEAPGQAQSRAHHPPGLHVKRAASSESSTAVLLSQQSTSSRQHGHGGVPVCAQTQKTLHACHGLSDEACGHDVSLPWSSGTRLRVGAACMLLCGYCAMLFMDPC